MVCKLCNVWSCLCNGWGLLRVTHVHVPNLHDLAMSEKCMQRMNWCEQCDSLLTPILSYVDWLG